MEGSALALARCHLTRADNRRGILASSSRSMRSSALLALNLVVRGGRYRLSGWVTYDEITPEPLGRVLRDIAGHEGLLSEIARPRVPA